MRNLLKAVAGLSFAGLVAVQAQATVLVTASAAGDTTTNVAGATTIDFESGCGYASCTNLSIVSGSVGGVYAAPYTDATKYSTVSGGQTTTFNLGTSADYFGLYWGSIDTYNTLSFYLGGNLVATYSGAPALGLLSNGGQTSWASNRYINFFFQNAAYDKVELYSGSNAFETDNHAFRKSSVPEPMNIMLMGLGLLGLALARKRKA